MNEEMNETCQVEYNKELSKFLFDTSSNEYGKFLVLKNENRIVTLWDPYDSNDKIIVKTDDNETKYFSGNIDKYELVQELVIYLTTGEHLICESESALDSLKRFMFDSTDGEYGTSTVFYDEPRLVTLWEPFKSIDHDIIVKTDKDGEIRFPHGTDIELLGKKILEYLTTDKDFDKDLKEE